MSDNLPIKFFNSNGSQPIKGGEFQCLKCSFTTFSLSILNDHSKIHPVYQDRQTRE